MPISAPPTEKALGRKVIVFLDTPPAAGSGIPTLVEVNAGMQASLHIYTPFNVRPTQNTGEGPRKVGAKSVPQQHGLRTYPAVEVQGSYRPQQLGTPGAAGNELYELIQTAVENGDKLTGVVFAGLDGDTDPIPANAVGNVYLFDPSEPSEGETGEGEFDELSFTTSLVIAGGEPIVKNHVFAA